MVMTMWDIIAAVAAGFLLCATLVYWAIRCYFHEKREHLRSLLDLENTEEKENN